ncbi:carboxypeptidase regulatory-like domain-containing protein [Wenzhouxiangella sp. EGI_FJ10409]|uniref:carboxypeptidase regulatory-like domain-containing protein n=1 Tax=Wenzhouxiangella sp. EGI_FJ10409 TaxID=3243767 RepID=UPI0035DC485E
MAATAVASDGVEFVQPDLEDRLQSGEQIDLLVQFEVPDLSRAYDMSWEERGRWVHKQLSAAVEDTQTDVRKRLEKQGAEVQSLKLGNMMIVTQSDYQLFDSVRSAPGVKRIYEKPEFELFDSEDEDTTLGGGPVANLDQIKATDVWDQLGFRGQDIVVGLNDSSPRYTHELLVDGYRGNDGGGSFSHDYNWFDPNTGASEPFPEGHGTLVVSIMTGDSGGTQTGVAPDAEWIACGGCAGGSCAGVYQCLDWMIAPTDLNGDNPDPDQRPHVVNNSWGSCSTTYDTSLDPLWDSMYAAGVMPFFSNGNSGNCGYASPPGLDTVGNPARSGRVMGIGSTTQTGGNYATHSNWGPTDNDNPGSPDSFDHFGYPDLKPNVSAPGQGIPGASSGSDTGTTSSTGTSFASPHATGAAAVMLSAAPCLVGDHQTIGSIMMETAVPVDYDGGGAGDPDVEPGVNHPNYAAGWGEIDLLAATQMAIEQCGPRGTLSGTVIDQNTSVPVAGVLVSTVDPEGNTIEATTDANGFYSMSLPETGSGEVYDIEFSRNGYVTTLITDFTIAEDEDVTLDVDLEPVAGETVSGNVDDANFPGDGVEGAELLFTDGDGFSYGPATTDANGDYSQDLPAGQTYDVSISAEGYESLDDSIGEVTGPITADFTLNAGLIELPATAALTVDRGDNGSTTATINNTGTADAEIDLAFGGSGAVLTEDFEGSFPPNDWNVVNDGDCPWETTDDFPMPGWTGDFRAAAADSDACGSGSASDTSLVTPSFSLAGASTAAVDFDLAIRSLSATTVDVDISVDGGAWQNVESWQGEDVAYPNDPVLPQNLDLSAWAGEDDVRLRWRYQAGWDYWVVVDDVEVTSDNAGVPWASVDPETVTVPQGGSVDVDLNVDATMLDVGTYNIPLMVTDGSAYDVTPTDFEVTVEAVPEIILPELIEMTVEYPTTGTQSIDVENIGGLSGDVDLTFEPEPFVEDFEGGDFPPEGWTVTDDSSPACPWLTTDDYPMSTFPGLVAGSTRGAAVDSDSCGDGVSVDTSLISPVINLGSPTPASLEFDFSQNDFGGTTTTVEATTDGGDTWQVLATYTGAVNDDAAARETVDLAPVAGNPEVQIRFRYVSGWDWYVYVDNVEIELPPVDWAVANPATVTVPAESTTQTDVEVDTSLLDGPGVYEATLYGSVDSPIAIAPSQLIVTVEPGQDLAGINGTVQSLGYCGSDPFDAAGATISIVGQNDTYTATADENGFYEIYIPSDETPVDITASAPNHLDGTDTGVELVPADSITVDFSLDLDEPCVDTAPADFSSTMDPGNTDTQTLTIGNADGAGQLDWTLEEAEPTVLAADGESGAGAGLNSGSHDGTDMFAAFGDELPAATRVGPAGAFDCDGAPGLVIHDDGTIENGYSGNPAVATDVTVIEGFEPEGERVLGTVCVALLSQGPESRDFELVVFDDDGTGGGPGTEIAAVPATATGLPDGLPDPIVWYSVDLTSENIVVESGRVYIGARWEVSDPNVFLGSDEDGPGGVGAGYFRTDDGEWSELGTAETFPEFSALFVRPQMQSPSGCASPSDVSWLSFSSSNGSVAAGGSEDVDVVIDSSGLIPGDYEASICVNSNDPENPVVAVPVSLTVTAPPSFATISGNVSSLGYCESNPFPAEGAELAVTGQSGTTFTTTADANGDYAIAFDSDDAPVDVTASAPDHVSETETDVALSEGGSVTLDFDLQIELGCTSIFEDEFLAVLEAGGSETQTMTMVNDGLAEATFELTTSNTTPAVNVDLMRIGHPGIDRDGDDSSRAGSIAAFDGEVRRVSVQPSGTDLSVGVLSPDDEVGGFPPTNLVDALNSFPDVTAEFYSGTLADVTVADLESYDVVVTTNNNQWGAANADVAVGDALADYVDAGGSIVFFNFPFDHAGWQLAGRYIDDEYGPFNMADADATGTVTMDITDTEHPIFEGVSTLESDTIRINVTPQNDAELIAEWSDGEALIAYNDYAVAFNALYSADGADAWTGDLDLMAYNAVKFIAGGGGGPVDWLSLSPETGSVSAGGQSEVDVIFDATGLADGTYTADVVVELDEGDGEIVTRTVPATLIVGEDGDVLFRDRFEQ